MRKVVTVKASEADRQRLLAIVSDRNSPQKHVWRAQIVLLTAERCGTMAVMRRTGTRKTAVWRRQERFMREVCVGTAARQDVALAHPAPQVGGRGPPCRRHPDGPEWRHHVLDKRGDGKRIGRCMQRHRHQEFIRFLNAVEAKVPKGKLIHAIAASYATHKHPKVRGWRQRHPRWTFHFTPTSASCLNAVEGFFAKLTKRQLKRGVFRSVEDLQTAINAFLTESNAEGRPFRWTKDPNKIIAAVKREHQTLDSIH